MKFATVQEIQQMPKQEWDALQKHMAANKCLSEGFCFYWVFNNTRYAVETLIDIRR